MSRKINRPTIRVEPIFTGERTIADAFGQAYSTYFESIMQAKSSADTFETPILAGYNQGISVKEAQTNGTATA